MTASLHDTTTDREYVLGTDREEIERLGLQHRVWRPRALDAWRRAGFTIGQHLVDVGCGPGYASIDLAEIVGAGGRVTSIDRSRRFLDVLAHQRTARTLDHVETVELDLDVDPLPELGADGAWCRWVLSFVRHPRDLVRRMRDALRPDGVLVLHEYLDYRSWRLAPRNEPFEEMVAAVMANWRAAGGEPDIGLELPRWVESLGFRIRSMTPLIEFVGPDSFVWQWPRSFIASALPRLEAGGHLRPGRAAAIAEALRIAESTPGTRMLTPPVLEIIAERM
jgi:SAM-dependent methyltransferase